MNNIKQLVVKNTGVHFERLINQTNQYYLDEEICICYKKPTPICVLESNGAQINKAFFEQKSTTDYYGIYQGCYFDFDAKSISGETFNVKKVVKPHQLKHLQRVKQHGGLAFILVEFVTHDRFFLIDIDELLENKTIKIDELDKNQEIHFTLNCFLDYIKTMKDIYALK